MKLKVGYRDYEVLALHPDDAEENDMEDLDGFHRSVPRPIICIRADRTAEEQAAILIHELIHAMFRTYRLPSKGLTEEEVCSRLDPALAALFKDNPGLHGVLNKALCSGRKIVR